MKIFLLAVLFLFLLVFMQGSAAAQKDRMKLGEKVDLKVFRASKGERKVIEPKTKQPEVSEKLDTKVERKTK